jgi:hypothetical protein
MGGGWIFSLLIQCAEDKLTRSVLLRKLRCFKARTFLPLSLQKGRMKVKGSDLLLTSAAWSTLIFPFSLAREKRPVTKRTALFNTKRLRLCGLFLAR